MQSSTRLKLGAAAYISESVYSVEIEDIAHCASFLAVSSLSTLLLYQLEILSAASIARAKCHFPVRLMPHPRCRPPKKIVLSSGGSDWTLPLMFYFLAASELCWWEHVGFRYNTQVRRYEIMKKTYAFYSPKGQAEASKLIDWTQNKNQIQKWNWWII